MAKHPTLNGNEWYFSDIPSYKGSAIYALVDDQGKVYIGSTSNLERRIKNWDVNIRMALATQKAHGLMAKSIGEAVLNGRKFFVRILLKLPPDMSRHDRVELEKVIHAQYGGAKNTYNTYDVSHNYSASAQLSARRFD